MRRPSLIDAAGAAALHPEPAAQHVRDEVARWAPIAARIRAAGG